MSALGVVLLAQASSAATAPQIVARDPRLWPSGTRLPVCYVDYSFGKSPPLDDFKNVIGIAAEWNNAASGITLDFSRGVRACDKLKSGCADVAEIRVMFDETNASRVGRDRVMLLPGEKAYCPTMQISLNDRDSGRWRWAVLHEFGHALGMVHEHQRADNCNVSNEEQRLLFPKRADDEDFLRRQFARAPYPLQPLTSFQPTSIMVYPAPKMGTEGSVSRCLVDKVPDQLSPFDLRLLLVAYPPKAREVKAAG